MNKVFLIKFNLTYFKRKERHEIQDKGVKTKYLTVFWIYFLKTCFCHKEWLFIRDIVIGKLYCKKTYFFTDVLPKILAFTSQATETIALVAVSILKIYRNNCRKWLIKWTTPILLNLLAMLEFYRLWNWLKGDFNNIQNLAYHIYLCCSSN